MSVRPGQRARMPRSLTRELRLVQGAIGMVASGAAPRVSLASLRHGPDLVQPAAAMALEAGVKIVPRWTAGDHVAGLAVEPFAGAIADD